MRARSGRGADTRLPDQALLDRYATTRLMSALPISALVIVLALFAGLWLPPLIVAGWAALVIASGWAAALLAQRVDHHAPQSATLLVACEVLHGLAWSLAAVFGLIGADPVVVFAIALAGIAANAISTIPLGRAVTATTLPLAVASVIVLGLAGGILNWSLATLLAVVTFAFHSLARQLCRCEQAAVADELEGAALIAELDKARIDSAEARHQADQATIGRARFLGTMSHELRTPLNAIIGFSEVLESELLGPHAVPQYKDYASDIRRSGEHLLDLVNELLQTGHIDARRGQLDDQPLSLAAIAEDCRRIVEARCKSRGIVLTTSFETLPQLRGDARAIRQLLLNLLSNAVALAPDSGEVHLRVAASSDGGQLVAVRDHGPGFSPAELDSAASGLNLPVVQRIMSLHQGRFDLFSKRHVGTETIATFPSARVIAADAEAVGSQPATLSMAG